MTLLLTKSDVADLWDMQRAVERTELVFREQAQGRTLPYPPFMVGHDNHEFRVNAGALAGLHVAGLRAGMRGGSFAVLYDTTTERPLCFMSYAFTYPRVGATVAVAVHHLARREARRLVVIGTGRIARVSLQAIACVRQFESIEVFSRQEENRNAYCQMAREQLGLQARPISDLEPAVREADVVVIATSAEGPVLRGAWLRPDAHVTTAGIRCEVDEETYLDADLVVVGSKVHEQGYVGWFDETNDNTLVRLAREGRLPWERILELGEAIVAHPRPKGRTVFRESQGGFGDLVLAHWLYQEAKRLGRGQEWDLSA
jgi:ornithine cyclodeaminase